VSEKQGPRLSLIGNLGGSVGTALLSTVVVQREQFHDFRIGEYANTFRLAVQNRVEQITSVFTAKGYDPVTATKDAYAQLKNVVRREAYVMAFNDAFLVVTIALLVGAVLVWLCQKTTTKKVWQRTELPFPAIVAWRC
jgi:DHA2 family multidrug resistance protein